MHSETVLGNRCKAPLKCPDPSCSRVFTNLSRVLKRSELDVYNIARLRTSYDPNTIEHCKMRDCPGYALPNPRVTQFICPVATCRSTHCKICKGAWHPDEPCAPNMEPVLQKILATGNSKMCPKCGNVVERTEGCDNMICACGAYWCYSCGQLRNPYGHTCNPVRRQVPNARFSEIILLMLALISVLVLVVLITLHNPELCDSNSLCSHVNEGLRDKVDWLLTNIRFCTNLKEMLFPPALEPQNETDVSCCREHTDSITEMLRCDDDNTY